MVLHRYEKLQIKEGRETIFLRDIGYPKGSFKEVSQEGRYEINVRKNRTYIED